MTDEIDPEPFDDGRHHQDPAGFFARLRESRPVAQVLMPDRGRTWIITRYADVRTALTDPRPAKDVHRWPGGSRSRPSEAVNCHAHMLDSDPPDHTRLPAAVEELLRFTSPVNYATDRFTTDALPIGDVVIPAGEWVFSAITAANTDPAQFPDPGRLDLGRDTSGHVAFGYGLHYCLGAPLARMETEVALRAPLAVLRTRIAQQIRLPRELRRRADLAISRQVHRRRAARVDPS